jgi:Zn-dependent protease
MISCPHCGHTAGDLALVCPACNGLIHAAVLEGLAARAKAAEQAGDPEAAVLWQKALLLLPPGTKQHAVILEHMRTLSSTQAKQASKGPAAGTWLARLGPIGLVLWKFKTIALILLTKGKLLLLGLTKLSTFSSMLLSLGVYAQIYGWRFALGMIVSIYIHEMGHVAELRKYGIPATAPMFIPGFGALIRSQMAPTVAADARVGLGGPIWGTSAAVACWGIYLATGATIWGVLAQWGAWINLFNLIPVWQLDGSHAFKALTRQHRIIAILAAAGMWAVSEDMWLLVIAGVGVYRLFTKDEPQEPDQPVLLWWCALVVVLGLLCRIPLPAIARPSS